MAIKQTDSRKQDRLLKISQDRPVLIMLGLYSTVWIIKIFDTFVIRLDEVLGEAILTKALGFLIVALYLWAAGKGLGEIGFHRKNLPTTLLLSLAGFGLIYVLAFALQLVILNASGEEAALFLSAVDPKTGLSGGVLFGLWLVFTNLFNSAMEEGLFRGLMLRHFLIRYGKWGTIFLQAVLFSIWHLSWPLRHLLDGQMSPGELAYQAFGLTLSTLISGVVYGWFYFRTNNLWGSFIAHVINNSIFNVLFIKTASGLQSGLEFIPLLLFFLIAHLLMLPVISGITDRAKIYPVRPWDGNKK